MEGDLQEGGGDIRTPMVNSCWMYDRNQNNIVKQSIQQLKINKYNILKTCISHRWLCGTETQPYENVKLIICKEGNFPSASIESAQLPERV